LQSEPRPEAAQIVVNALDLSGDMWIFGETGQPVNDHLRETAAAASVPVMAIRAVAAGALTDQLDRRVDNDHRWMPSSNVRRASAGWPLILVSPRPRWHTVMR
jgi:hypothetical protein